MSPGEMAEHIAWQYHEACESERVLLELLRDAGQRAVEQQDRIAELEVELRDRIAVEVELSAALSLIGRWSGDLTGDSLGEATDALTGAATDLAYRDEGL